MKITNPSQILSSHEANPPDKVGTFRRILPQFLAAIAQYLAGANLGLALAFPTIVIPAVTGDGNSVNKNETLFLTKDEASWLGSIQFITQFFGCFLSGLLCDYFGRKKSIVLIFVVPAIGWLILGTAYSQANALAGFGLLGFGVGLTNSVTYLSEVAEASARGVLLACAGSIGTLAIASVYLNGTFFPWRYVAFISMSVPIVGIVYAIFLPETPIWLLSKKRDNEALKSLQWLRGWVSSSAVATELDQLKQISETSNICKECEKYGTKCDHPPPGMMDKLKDMTNKRTLKPFILVFSLFLFMQFSGMFATRPYIVGILGAHGISLNPNSTTVALGAIGAFANVVILFTIRFLGKRKIYLYSMFGNFLTCFGLAIYGFAFFPADWTSYDTGKHHIIKDVVGNWNYFALSMFLFMQFFLSVGVSSVPYFLVYELFPFKSRSSYCSLVSALNQLFAFVAAKTYYNSENLLSLPGVFCFYGILGVLGFVLTYFMLPETEQRSLEDIELHYSDNKKSIFDIKIGINAAAGASSAEVEPKVAIDTQTKY